MSSSPRTGADGSFAPAARRAPSGQPAVRAGEGRADASGRFEIRLNGPVPMGESRLRVFGEALNLETRLRLSPPAPPDAGPVRFQDAADGLRIDWMTPGGGVQTTQILR